MRAANAGDATAYTRLLQSMAPVIRAGVVRGLARAGLPVSEAEDVVQETLLAVHLKRGTWDARLPLMPWLMTIARYKLIDALRRSGRRVHVPIEDFSDTLPEAEAEPQLEGREIERHLALLPPRQNAVVRSIAIEQRTIAETAAHLSISAGAVRVALHRGLLNLAQKLRR